MPDGSFSPVTRLSRRQKAALLVQFMLSSGVAPDLSALPEDVQLTLTRELGRLGPVTRVTLDAVVAEFLDELDALGLSGPGGITAALATLSDRLSPSAAAKLRAETGGSDPWPIVTALGTEEMVNLMQREAVEVCAIALSKLQVSRAAELLSRLPGERARRITYAMRLTEKVEGGVVAVIGRALADDYSNRRPPAFTGAPSQRLGAILTTSQNLTRDSVLEGLDHADPAFAEDVRRAIFTFADIPARLAAPDVPKAVRVLDQAQLVTALAHGTASGGALAGAVDHLLSNLSQRMAEQLRSDMADRGAVKPADGEAAQSAIITALRTLADQGDITLFAPDPGA